MYLDKMIKRELLVLIVSVITIIIIILGIFYIKNSNMNNENNNIIKMGDLSIKYCTDYTCNTSISNFGNTIGTDNIDGESRIRYIKKYEDTEALNNKPYIFNIKNNSKMNANVSILIKEDIDYKPYDNIEDLKKITDLYLNSIKIGISECSNGINREDVTVKLYNELDNNLLLFNELINSNNSKTYCLWTWIDNNVEEDIDKSYFVAKMEYKYETYE